MAAMFWVKSIEIVSWEENLFCAKMLNLSFPTTWLLCTDIYILYNTVPYGKLLPGHVVLLQNQNLQ